MKAERENKPFRTEAVRQYGIQVQQFQERLFVLMHMLSMPARVLEISGIRFKNTMNGGVRNTMVHNQMISFITTYHKGYRITGEAKIIHRYMLREVGELIVWYLWLILPFWQQVQGMIQGASQVTTFLWADEVVRVGKVMDEEVMREEDEDEEGSTAGEMKDEEELKAEQEEAWKQLGDGVWSNDRARRTVQRHSKRLLGARLTIRAWGHFAIGMANRFLNQWSKQEESEESGEMKDE